MNEYIMLIRPSSRTIFLNQDQSYTGFQGRPPVGRPSLSTPVEEMQGCKMHWQARLAA
ncbi:MAG: hypothetical protein ACU4EP_00950 [Candidatus Nitrosoglobus sp.]